jgi:ABC-type multidrug transport system fused ATPase/permease subunit
VKGVAQDIGKLLFSFTIDKDLGRKEFLRMGRAIRYSNSRKIMMVALVSIFAVFFLSAVVSAFFLLLFIIVAVEIALYMEFSIRGIADNLQKKVPICYDFYEDGLIETMEGKSELLLYGRFKAVKMSKHLFTLVGRKTEIVVVPRSLIGEDADRLLMKLQRIIGG